MKNSTAPNRKTGRMIAKNLIVLFTVALAAFYGIQAWFTDKQSSDADGINIECHAPDGIEIAVVKHGDPAPTDDAAYKNTIELNSENYSFIDDIKMTEVSSDGYTFYKPPLKQENGVASPILDVDDWDLADSSVHYLSFDRQILAKQLGISTHQLSYVTHSGEGEGLLFYGSTILPFVDHFPKNTELYRIMTTKPQELKKEDE